MSHPIRQLEEVSAPAARAEKAQAKNRLDQIKEAFKDREPTVQQVRTYIYDTFDVDMKPMQVSRLIDGIKR